MTVPPVPPASTSAISSASTQPPRDLTRSPGGTFPIPGNPNRGVYLSQHPPGYYDSDTEYYDSDAEDEFKVEEPDSPTISERERMAAALQSGTVGGPSASASIASLSSSSSSSSSSSTQP